MSISIDQLMDRAAELLDKDINISICLIVKSSGSSPATAGSLMVVDETGGTLGTIGGGCVEADVRRAAVEASSSGVGCIQTIAMDHEFAWEQGLICGGTIEVVIALHTDAKELRSIAQSCRDRKPTQLSLTIPEGTWTINVPPRPHVLVVGAGHLGQDVCKLLLSLDFSVSVFDDRKDMLDRFIPAEARHVCGEIATTLAAEHLDDDTYVVIVTRGHKDDAVALHAVINRGAGYIGMVGSKRKIGLIFNELKDRGVPPKDLASVYAPIGVDIGAKTAGEIALAIAAQLVGYRRSKETVPAVTSP